MHGEAEQRFRLKERERKKLTKQSFKANRRESSASGFFTCTSHARLVIADAA